MSEQTDSEQSTVEPGTPFDYIRFPLNVVPARDTFPKRVGLRTRAYTQEGQLERYRAELKVRIRPTTIARLRLYCDDYDNGFPLIEEVVDEAIQNWLNNRFW